VHWHAAGSVGGPAFGRLHAVEVVATGLVAARRRGVGHEAVAPAVGRAQRARPLLLVALLPRLPAVVHHVAPWQAHVADHGRHQVGNVGAGHAATDQRRPYLRRIDQAIGAADAAVGIGQDRAELLALLGVARAEGDVERVGSVPDVVGEQCRAARVLPEVVVAAAADEGGAERTARRLRQ